MKSSEDAAEIIAEAERLVAATGRPHFVARFFLRYYVVTYGPGSAISNALNLAYVWPEQVPSKRPQVNPDSGKSNV